MKALLTAWLFILPIGIWGSAHMVLPVTQAPQTFEVNGNILALGFGTFIKTLKLPKLTVVEEFGKYGEGPGEFIPEDKDMGLTLFFLPDSIFVTSRNKISHFTYNGKHLNEFRPFHGFSHKPLSSGFIGLNTVTRNGFVYHDITLFTPKCQIITRLFSKRHWFQRNRDINPIDVSIPRICVEHDMVFYQNSTDNIEITDNKGKKKATTKIEFELKR